MPTKNQTDATGNILVSSPEVIEIPASYADFALAAGLPHDASKGDVLAAMGRAKADHAKILDVIGAKSTDDAIGKITAERSTHGELVTAIVGPEERSPTSQGAIAKLAADRKSADRTRAVEMLGEAKAQGKNAGDKAMGIFDQFGMKAFQAHLDALSPAAALVGTVPQQLPSSPTPAQPAANGANGKSTVVLTPDDEKMIKARGLNREEFIARKQAAQDEAAEFANS